MHTLRHALLIVLLALLLAAPAAPLAAQSCPTMITPGTPLSCALRTPAETDSFTLGADAGDVVLLRVAKSAGDMTPRVQLRDPNGAILCQAGESYAPGAEISRCVLPQSGSYGVQVRDVSGTRIGTYTLYLQRLNRPVDSLNLAVGQATPGTIPIAAQLATYQLRAQDGDTVLLRVSRTAGMITPSVRVVDGVGQAICAAGTSYSDATEVTCVLPTAGMYTVLVGDVRMTQTGAYNLFAQQLTRPTGAARLAVAEPVQATIQSVADADSYTLEADAGDVLLLRVGTTDGTLLPGVRVIAPDGMLVCAAGTTYSDGAEIARCALPTAGTYTVLVVDMRGTQTGGYTLFGQFLSRPLRSAPLVLGAVVPVTIEATAALATLTVAGHMGEMLYLRAAATAGQVLPLVRLVDIDGVTICAGGTSYSTGVEIAQCLLPRDGIYSLLLGDVRGTRTGSIALVAQRLLAPVEARGVGSTWETTGTITAAAEADTYTLLGDGDDALEIRMVTTSGALTPALRVFDPGGILVCQTGESYRTTAEIGRCLLPRSGRFTIIATDVRLTQLGGYRLSIACASPPCAGAVALPTAGGEITLGTMRLSVPPATFTSTISVSAVALAVPPHPLPSGTRPLRSIALQAQVADGTLVTTAAQLLTYTLPLSVTDLAAAGGRLDRVTVQLWDVAQAQWVAVAAQTTANPPQVVVRSSRIGDLVVTVPQRQVFLPLTQH